MPNSSNIRFLIGQHIITLLLGVRSWPKIALPGFYEGLLTRNQALKFGSLAVEFDPDGALRFETARCFSV